MRFLPVDIKAVSEYGLRDWARDASWPVSNAEIRALGLAAIRALDSAGSKVDATWSDCIWSDTRFSDYIVQRLHAILVASRASARGLNLVARGDARSLYRPDYGQLASDFQMSLQAAPRIDAPFRDIRRRWIGNKCVPLSARLSSALRRPNTWNIGAENILKAAYLRRQGLSCHFPRVSDWPREQPLSELPPAIRLALGEALEEIVAAIDGMVLSDEDRLGLIGLWSARLCALRTVYDATLRLRNLPNRVLWGSQGNSTYRAVVYALKRHGTHVVAFQHGHNPVWVDHPYMAFNEVRGAAEFVCGTPGQADAYRRMIDRSGISETGTTRVWSVDTPVYDAWRRQRRPRQPIRRVLMPGFPGLARVYTYDWTGFGIMRNPVEVQVSGMLRRAGYEVVYKPHPETASLMAPLMAPHVDSVALGSFEEAVDGVDAAIYLYPFSTTLPYVLLHGLPVVMIDVEGRDWLPEIRDGLARRCAFVPAALVPDNRVHIDEQQVVDGVRAAVDLDDDTFIHALYSPPPLHENKPSS